MPVAHDQSLLAVKGEALTDLGSGLILVANLEKEMKNACGPVLQSVNDD